MKLLNHFAPTQKQCLISLLVLISILFCVVAHASHCDDELQSIESQHCHHFQQNIEDSLESLSLAPSAILWLELPQCQSYHYLPLTSIGLTPPLRAPPSH